MNPQTTSTLSYKEQVILTKSLRKDKDGMRKIIEHYILQ